MGAYPELPQACARAVGFSVDMGVKVRDVEIRLMREMAERHGWTFLRTWAEEWRSWLDDEDRPAFSSMVSELEELGVGVVMVPEAAALSDDPVNRYRMVRVIGEAGAVVCELPRTERPRRGWLR